MPITSKPGSDSNEVVVVVAGRFDFSTHQEFVKAYKENPKGSKRFVVDLKAAEYMDSSAMGMLLQLREYSRQQDVTLINGNEGIREILRIANFDKLFAIR